MPRIGIDCDITLQHDSVNGGKAYGFILKPEGSKRGSITIQRQTYVEGVTYTDRVKLWATVILTDNLTNPNGSRHDANRDEMYTLYLAYLAERSDITIETVAGSISGLIPTQVKSTEKIIGDLIEATLSLNNGEALQTAPDAETAAGTYLIPVTVTDDWADPVHARADILTAVPIVHPTSNEREIHVHIWGGTGDTDDVGEFKLNPVAGTGEWYRSMTSYPTSGIVYILSIQLTAVT